MQCRFCPGAHEKAYKHYSEEAAFPVVIVKRIGRGEFAQRERERECIQSVSREVGAAEGGAPGAGRGIRNTDSASSSRSKKTGTKTMC